MTCRVLTIPADLLDGNQPCFIVVYHTMPFLPLLNIAPFQVQRRDGNQRKGDKGKGKGLGTWTQDDMEPETFIFFMLFSFSGISVGVLYRRPEVSTLLSIKCGTRQTAT